MNSNRALTPTASQAAKNAALAAALGLIFLIFPVGRGLTHLSYDLPFTLRPDLSVTNLVVIYLDDASHQHWKIQHRVPWNRTLHARLITNLVASGVRAIALDILFVEPAQNEAEDQALARAIELARGRIVLGAEFTKGKASVSKLLEPLTAFRGAADDNWGFVDLAEPDGDRIVRHHHHSQSGWKEPSLTWRLATLLKLPVAQSPQGQTAERWVNYYGPPGALLGVSYYEALEDLETGSGERFRDRIVFVGAGSTAGYAGDERDSFRNPYTWLDGSQSPGVDLHATLFLNLLREDWLRRASPWTEILIITLAGGLFGWVLARLRPWPAAGVGLVGWIAMAGLAPLLLAWWHFWFPWMVIGAVQIPAALLGSLLFRSQGTGTAAEAGATTEFPAAPATGRDQEAPLQIPDHELLRRIGRGSYGDVWLARSVMGTWRAVKIVHRKSFGHDRRFEREFEGLKRFEPISRSHEGLVDILHIGRNEAAGYFYYVMELADAAPPRVESRNELRVGRQATDTALSSQLSTQVPLNYSPRTLRSELDARRRLPLKECLKIGLALSSALTHLHQQGLIHRDIKPSNIIFVNGLPKLADIGLVAGVEEARSFVGTEGYIPPEGPGTAQSDLFSLGRVLYEVSTGLESRQFPELPADPGPSPESEWLLQFYGVILNACEKDLRRRHASAQQLHADLLRLNWD